MDGGHRLTGVQVGATPSPAVGVLTDVSQQFNLNFNISVPAGPFTSRRLPWNAANNRGFALWVSVRPRHAGRITITVVNGITSAAQGGRVADAIYNPITTTYPQGAPT